MHNVSQRLRYWKLSLKMLDQGGTIIDNKLIGNIVYALAISNDIENSLNIVKNIGF